MKNKIVRYVGALAGLVALSALSLHAGGWAYELTSPTGASVSYSASVSVPSAASAQQAAGAYGYTIVVNSGPLGYYQIQNASTPFYTSGSISAGTYSIYEAIVGGAYGGASGYSVVAISW